MAIKLIGYSDTQ